MTPPRHHGSTLALAAIGMLIAASALAQDLSGTVRAAADGLPVAGAFVRIHSTDTNHPTDIQGRFTIEAVGAEPVAIHVSHAAYVTWHGVVDPASGPVEILLEAASYTVDEIVVTGGGGRDELIDTSGSVGLSGVDLDRRLGGTLAATMADLPGVAQRSMGPASARPVVRGLDGNRLLVLEDGTSTGDLSASSPDHAVIVEPLLTEDIALVRGPAALQYGSNVIGGAVDVGRGAFPGHDIQTWNLALGSQLSSVDGGVAGQLGVKGRQGALVLRGDAVVRRTGDLRTPAGDLGNTDSDGWDLSSGASWLGDGWDLSAAAGRVEAGYGIPGGFKGGHANGVDIELERTRYDGRLRVFDPGLGIERIEAVGSYKSYYHEELESSGTCGVSFGLLTYDAQVQARFDHGTVVGLSLQHRDIATACLSFLPRTEEWSVGGFAYHKREYGGFDLEGALRWDHRTITPATADTNKTGVVRERDFGGVSGSVAGTWRLDEHQQLRATVTHTFQPPSLEELFSEGPHLAAYSYDVGNADLDVEQSWGAELEYRLESERVTATAAVFRYEIDGYIFAADTGELEYGPGDEGFLSLYQYTGLDARLQGAELSAAYRLGSAWSLRSQASYVRGDLVGDNSASLPRIPPLAGRLELERRGERSRLTLTGRGAARQDRLGEFEDTTAGWFTCDATFEWEIPGDRWHHAIVLRGHNLLDREYRNHLSRIKSIMPEAGRGVSLVYQVDR